MPIDVKAVKQRILEEAKEQERRKKIAATGGNVGLLGLKNPGSSVVIQFWGDFPEGMEIPWHDHLEDFKQSGPCRKFFGYDCLRCNNPAFRAPDRQKPQYFFKVYAFAKKAVEGEPEEKYPNVGNRILHVKQAANHPWEFLFDGYATEGIDLTENKYIYKRNTAPGAGTAYTLRQKGAAVDLPEDVKCPTDEDAKMVILRLHDRALYDMIKEAETDEEEEAPVVKKRKVVAADPEEDRAAFAAIKQQAKSVSKRIAETDDDDEEEVLPAPPKVIKRPVPQPIASDDDDDEEEVVPVKKKAAKVSAIPVQKPAAKVEVDDDDDEDVGQFRLGVS